MLQISSQTRVFLSIVANIRPRAKSIIISWQYNKGFQQVSEKNSCVGTVVRALALHQCNLGSIP